MRAALVAEAMTGICLLRYQEPCSSGYVVIVRGIVNEAGVVNKESLRLCCMESIPEYNPACGALAFSGPKIIDLRIHRKDDTPNDST
jgi:hypothetical protein